MRGKLIRGTSVDEIRVDFENISAQQIENRILACRNNQESLPSIDSNDIVAHIIA